MLAIAIWLLHAVENEGTIGVAHAEVRFNLYFTFDETYAVLDGRSPLVDFAAQYGSLWPYAFAGVMSLVGTTLGVWIALALATTAAGMLAIYALLRRVTRSAIVALALFLPILASSFVILNGTRQNRWTFANYFGTFPMRYAGPLDPGVAPRAPPRRRLAAKGLAAVPRWPGSSRSTTSTSACPRSARRSPRCCGPAAR